jgi:negative regulator of sigma E activity
VWNIFKSSFNKSKEETKMPANQGKQWYQSMTIWANALLAVLAVVQPQVQGFISAHPEVSAIVVTISNLLLRLRTDKPVA